MITANQLLGQKVLTQQQENEFMKKIQAMGIVGQTAASILRIFKGKKPICCSFPI